MKTWPATPVRSVVQISLVERADLVGMLPVEAGAAGVGQPFELLPIDEFRLPIQAAVFDSVSEGVQSAIGNCKSEISYVV